MRANWSFTMAISMGQGVDGTRPDGVLPVHLTDKTCPGCSPGPGAPSLKGKRTLSAASPRTAQYTRSLAGWHRPVTVIPRTRTIHPA